jgi:hypothetical protein
LQNCDKRLLASSCLFLQLDLKTREIYWLIGKHSPLSLENKLLIYKTALKPVWKYGIELFYVLQVQHSCHPAISIQTSLNSNQRTTVCLQSNSPFRPTQPARQHGIMGTDSYSSHDPGLAPQPSHGTTSAPAKLQALKTKMDF